MKIYNDCKGDIKMLDLYYSETCPYCRKVLSYLDENCIDFNRKDVTDPNNYDKLVALGGMAQVPFLDDTDEKKSMYESDVIIDYIRNKYNLAI